MSQQTFERNPGVLSMKRGMMITDGAFYNLIGNDTEGYEKYPLSVVRHGIRGVMGGNEESDTAKGGERSASNIQQTESAKTLPKATGMVAVFGLRMIDIEDSLYSCSGETPAITQAFSESVKNFLSRAKGEQSEGLKEISRRIARNIANGSWLWRNRSLANNINIRVTSNGSPVAEFDALDVPVKHFNDYSSDECKVAAILEDGMRGSINANLKIEAFVSFGIEGSLEVFPSQAMLESKPRGFARPLYKLNLSTTHEREQAQLDGVVIMGQAALRDQKISNRLRCFDTWYPDFSAVGKPIPVEPNGANLEMMRFMRGSRSGASASDFFKRLNTLDATTPEGMFSLACMIRGGVYSEGSQKAAATATPPSKEDLEKEINEKPQE